MHEAVWGWMQDAGWQESGGRTNARLVGAHHHNHAADDVALAGLFAPLASTIATTVNLRVAACEAGQLRLGPRC